MAKVTALFLCALTFLSCDLFNKPLQDFLGEWTSTAKIMEHRFDGSYPATGGLTNLPSGGGRVITYYLVNPQNYVLTPAATFASGGLTQGSDYSIGQDASDRIVLRLTLNDSYLQSLDGGGTEISPTVTITEPNSGRNFGSYTVPLRVNSAPPVLSNAVIMKYTDTGTEKYAVCFNLPAMDATDVHRDITRITVDGTFNNQPFSGTYQVTGGGTGTVTVDGVPESLSSDYQAIGSEFADTGNKFVGIKTGLDLGPATPSCRITLTDSSGATSVTTVSTASTMVNKIYVDGDTGDDSNTGTVNSPVQTIAAALDKLRDVPNGSVILQSDIRLDGGMTVDSGVSVTITGDNPGRTVTSKTGGIFSVNSGSLTLGGNIILTGESGNGGAVIVDGGSFTMENGSEIKGSNASPTGGGSGGGVYAGSGEFTMNGGIISGNNAGYGGGVYVKGGTFTMSGTAVIKGNTADRDGGGVYVENGTFTMKGGTISGNNADNGGGVYVGGGEFTMSGGTISGNTATTYGGGVYVNDGGAFTMSGTAVIKGNTADRNGAGVYVEDGTFTMTGGTIGGAGTDANTADGGSAFMGSGGGVFVGSGGIFNMSDTAAIKGNTADSGGGVCVDIGGTFNMSGTAAIKGNTASIYSGGGGGVYVGGGEFTMNGGTISGNNADNGGGVYVYSGEFTMNGGTISGNTADRDGGGVYVENGTFTMRGGIIEDAIYGKSSFSLTGTPTITGNTITLASGASINVNALATTNITGVTFIPSTYTEGTTVLTNASDSICDVFTGFLGSVPADQLWWIDNENGSGKLRKFTGNYDSTSNTVTVTTVEGLTEWNEYVNGINQNLNCTLGANITLPPQSGYACNWTPVGNRNNRYSGTFDGGGYIISGLYMNDPDNTGDVGLFSAIGETGTVKNLNLIIDVIAGGGFVGSIAGVNYGTISGCSVTGGTVISGYIMSSVLPIPAGGAGGIAGGNNNKVINCHFNGTSGSTDVAGGIVGSNMGGKIVACYSEGKVSASMSRAGGVVGFSLSGISDDGPIGTVGCYSTSDVSGGEYVGGIGGAENATACYAIGNVSGSTSGGIAGVTRNITDCYWSGNSTTGIGSGSGTATKVDGATTTWQAATGAMNAAITTWNASNGNLCVWKFQQNNGINDPPVLVSGAP